MATALNHQALAPIHRRSTSHATNNAAIHADRDCMSSTTVAAQSDTTIAAARMARRSRADAGDAPIADTANGRTSIAVAASALGLTSVRECSAGSGKG